AAAPPPPFLGCASATVDPRRVVTARVEISAMSVRIGVPFLQGRRWTALITTVPTTAPPFRFQKDRAQTGEPVGRDHGTARRGAAPIVILLVIMASYRRPWRPSRPCRRPCLRPCRLCRTRRHLRKIPIRRQARPAAWAAAAAGSPCS